ncbi:MAG: hypothetical protein QOE65_1391 [Solirubrobacteraceae bacterium]|nr:hypothetical protein [Solirubrobacteraceae bacterium]
MFNTRPYRFVAVALAALVAALGLAACGGGGGGEDVNKVLKETFSGNKRVTSGKVELSVKVKTEGGSTSGGPIELKLTGPLQNQGGNELPKFDFDLALAASGQSFKAGAVSTGDAGFLKFQGQAYSVPDKVFKQFKDGYVRSRAQREGSSGNQSFASLGINPQSWLKDPKNEGEDDVGGAKTIHISSGVDVSKLLDDVNQILSKARGLGGQAGQLPQQITPQQRKAVQGAVKDVSFDLYTGKDDKTLRRMNITLKFQIPQASRQAAQGLTGGELAFDLVINDLNKPQTISPPANARPFSELAQAARGVLGGLGGLGASGAAGGGATTTTPPASGGTGGAGDAKAQRYLQCLQQAGGDVGQAQKCAALLNSG